MLCGALGSGCGTDDIDNGEPIELDPPIANPLESDNALQLEINALIQKILLVPEHLDHVPAIERLADIGEPAVPAVLELLDHENEWVRLFFIKWGPLPPVRFRF